MADQPDTIFNAAPEVTPPTVPSTQAKDPFEDLLGSIKNERGEQKYKDLADALTGLRNAQEYIPSLKTELSQKDAALATLQAEVLRLQTIESTVEKLASQNITEPVKPTAPVIDENRIAQLVNQSLTQRQREDSNKVNLQTVVATLQQSFGADAEKTFYGKAEELGMDKAEINALAAKSPKAVLKMFGIGEVKSTPSLSSSSVNTAAYQKAPDSQIGRNTKTLNIGATSAELHAESLDSKKMVEELHAMGKTVADLSDPKLYNQFFK